MEERRDLEALRPRALADPVGAKEYLDREWSPAAITSRHEWLFTYDVLSAEI